MMAAYWNILKSRQQAEYACCILMKERKGFLMASYKIAVIGGDGTGPEVTVEAVKVMDAAAAKYGFSIEKTEFDFGGERYMRTGEVLPAGALDELKAYDAIYLGAIGHPDVKPGILEKGILLEARFGLDQYINLRPVKLYDRPLVTAPSSNRIGPEPEPLISLR